MPYQQITRAQFRSLIQDRLGNTVFWRVDELNRSIQESLRVWNSLTGFWRRRALITGAGTAFPTGTVADLVFYDLPNTLTSKMRLLFNNKPMDPTSLHDLDTGRPEWEGEVTTDGGSVPTEPSLWAPVGLTTVAIWPADAAGGNSLVAEGISSTPILTADGDFVDIGREELDHLIDYIVHISSFKEGGGEFDSTQALLVNFLKGAAERNSMLMASSKFREWMGIHHEEESRPHRVGERVGAR